MVGLFRKNYYRIPRRMWGQVSAAPGQSKPLVGINYNKSFRLATNDFLKKNLRDTLAFVSLVSLGHYRACTVHLMSSLLGSPNSIQQFKWHTTLYMLSVLCVVLVYNFLGKLLHLVIKVSWKFLIAHKQLNVNGFSNSRWDSKSSKYEKLLMFFQQQFIFTLLDTQITFGLNINQLNCEV